MNDNVSRRTLLASSAAFAASVVAPAAFAEAQAWPSKPVRVLVGFSAGGNIDNLARVTCARLAEVFGQQFVVENRVGAMGTIAANDVVRAAADGHTFFWAGTGTISIFPALGKPPYDALKDLAPISVIGTSPQVLIVNAKLPIKTLSEFIAYVKERPKQLAYAGGGGPGSVSNLLMALFLKRAGLEMNAVSYRGTAPALTDIIGGHVPAMFIPLPEALPQATAGSVRMLALSDDRRAAQAKDVPTVAESGFPGFRGVSWNGMMAPAATPRPVIDRVAAEFIKATKDPAFIAQLDKYGAAPLGLTPDEFVKFLQEDMALWAEAVKIAGVTLADAK